MKNYLIALAIIFMLAGCAKKQVVTEEEDLYSGATIFEEIESDELAIPHPRIEERAFVLVPLLEVKPDLILPFSGKPIAGKVEEMGQSGVVRLED